MRKSLLFLVLLFGMVATARSKYRRSSHLRKYARAPVSREELVGLIERQLDFLTEVKRVSGRNKNDFLAKIKSADKEFDKVASLTRKWAKAVFQKRYIKKVITRIPKKRRYILEFYGYDFPVGPKDSVTLDEKYLAAISKNYRKRVLGLEFVKIEAISSDVVIKNLANWFPNLESLRFWQCGFISDESLSYFKKLPLKKLVLTGADLTERCVTHLKDFVNLKLLHIDDTYIMASSLDKLKVLKKLEKLEKLEDLKLPPSYGDNQDGFKHLPDFANLRRLSIDYHYKKVDSEGEPIDTSSLKYFSKYENLKELYVKSLHIIDDGLRSLPKILRVLDIENVKIDQERFLKPLSSLVHLEDFTISFKLASSQAPKTVRITERTVKYLPESLDVLGIEYPYIDNLALEAALKRFKKISELAIVRLQGYGGTFKSKNILSSEHRSKWIQRSLVVSEKKFKRLAKEYHFEIDNDHPYLLRKKTSRPTVPSKRYRPKIGKKIKEPKKVDRPKVPGKKYRPKMVKKLEKPEKK